MNFFRIFIVFMTVFSLAPCFALAANISSLSMVSLAVSSKPWTITISKDGSVVASNSSYGYFIFELPYEETKTTIPAEKAELILQMAQNAGYASTRDIGQEPKIRLLATLEDGTTVINSGPNGLEDPQELETFRKIEAQFAAAADVENKSDFFLFYNENYKLSQGIKE